LLLGRASEIVGVEPEVDVGPENRLPCGGLAELGVVGRQQQEPPGDQSRQDDHHRRRNNPPRAPLPEVGESELALLQVLEDQRGNQEAGDHEEHIHSDVTTRHAQPGVVQHHGQNCDGPETVDLGPVTEVRDQGHG